MLISLTWEVLNLFLFLAATWASLLLPSVWEPNSNVLQEVAEGTVGVQTGYGT